MKIMNFGNYNRQNSRVSTFIFSMVKTMLQISQKQYNISYHPILDNYEQFAMLPKIISNNSNYLFGGTIEYGKRKIEIKKILLISF